jgi:eukaryotic-like serine/threonine-protein kinase
MSVILRTGDRLGPFIINKLLADNGGMSRIYLANEADRPSSAVVIKLNLPTSDNRNAYQDLLRKETRYLQLFRHPGVVRIFPVRMDKYVSYEARVEIDGCDYWYFVMEHISGDNLATLTKRLVEKMPLEWRIELFYQLLIIVQYLHRSGFGHCDLKPDNILLRESASANRLPQPVLLDFGCTAQIGRPMDQVAASLRYSPPEVIVAMQREDMAPQNFPLFPDKIDIWALGAIFFELVTGRMLLPQKSREEIRTSVLRGELAAIRDYRPELHHSLDKLLHVMLRKEPLERPDIDTIIKAIEERISCIKPPRIFSMG